MTDREKLIDLLEQAESAVYWNSGDRNFIEKIADHLIADGVTFQRWIPVTERLPERFETVIVCLDDNTRSIAYRSEGDVWIAMWVLSGVTHWMPLPPAPEDMK